MQLTQKEASYLKDAASQEQLCVNLYQRYSQQASDPQLAQLLQSIASQEQQHLQTIKQLQQGQIPNVAQSQSGGQQSGGGQQQQQNFGMGGFAGQQTNAQSGGQGGQSADRQACETLLSMEKGVSDLYDHAVFEFTNHQARAVIDHIQNEEHHHGYQLFQYMNQQGWYQPQ